MKYFKRKGIGALLSTSLLILMAIVTIVSFQTWFSSYSSTLYTDVENGDVSLSKIEAIVGNNVYFKNGKNGENITINSVKVGTQVCNISQTNISANSIGSIGLGSCLNNFSNTRSEVVLYSENSGIFSTFFFIKSNGNSSNQESGSSESVQLFNFTGGLLLHSDTTNGNTTFTDSSNSSHSISVATGNVIHSTSEAIFGASSVYFDDTGYLSVVDSNEFNLGTENFTIDFWFNVNSSCVGANNVGLLSMGTSNSDRFTIGVGDCSNSLNFFWNGGISINGGSISEDQWYHFALVRLNNNFSLYLDGERKNSVVSASTMPNYSTFYIGRSIEDANPTPYFFGHIDEVRFLKGVAVWNDSFTVPDSSCELGYCR